MNANPNTHFRWIKVLGLIGAAMVLVQSAWGAPDPPPCEEHGPHWTDWILDDCPQLDNSPSVSPNSICQHYGAALTMPTVTPPTYTSGHKHKDGTYDCKSDVDKENGTISFTVSSIQWDPPLPGTLTNGFSSTAYVVVTSSDPSLCPSPGRTNIDTCSWGYYSCDNPHHISVTAYECYHENNNSGTICSTGYIIEDVIDTSTCEKHDNATCGGQCNLKDDPSTPLEQQYLWAGPCPGGDASQVQLWQTIYSGCTSCTGEAFYNACVIQQLPQSALLINQAFAPKPPRKKIPCT